MSLMKKAEFKKAEKDCKRGGQDRLQRQGETSEQNRKSKGVTGILGKDFSGRGN